MITKGSRRGPKIASGQRKLPRRDVDERCSNQNKQRRDGPSPGAPFAGEMIFVTLGLGQLLMMGRDLNDINEVVAVTLLIVVIGFLMDAFSSAFWNRASSANGA